MNHQPRTEELSAYLDGQLAAEELAELEQHIERCAQCREELQDLQSTVALLQALPSVRPPRSFTLDPALVAPRFSRWLPRLRWASVALSLLLMLTVGIDLSNIGRAELESERAAITSGGAAATSAPAPTVAAAAAEQTSDFDTAARQGEEPVAPAGGPPLGDMAAASPTTAAEATFAPAAMAPTSTPIMILDEGAGGVFRERPAPTAAADENEETDAQPTGPAQTSGNTGNVAQLNATENALAMRSITLEPGVLPPGALPYIAKPAEDGANYFQPEALVQTTQPSAGGGSDTVIYGSESTKLQGSSEQGGQEFQAPPREEPTAGAQLWLRAFEILVGALLAVSLVALAVLSRRAS